MNRSTQFNALILTALAALLLCGHATASSMAKVSQTIELEKEVKEEDLPPARPHSGYFSELHFTIAALQNHSFIEMFAANADAGDIVGEWFRNVSNDRTLGGDLYKPLRDALKNLNDVLATNAPPNLTFPDLVEMRLDNVLIVESLEPLDDALNELQMAKFQFPLLWQREASVVNTSDILELLEVLCRKHRLRSSENGGLGSMNWYQLFYTPAYPTYFNEGKLEKTLKRNKNLAYMQGHILPIPNEMVLTVDWKDYDAFVATIPNNYCCCNYPTQHPAHYRKCASGADGMNCSLCGSYCCLAGVQWCTSTNHVYP